MWNLATLQVSLVLFYCVWCSIVEVELSISVELSSKWARKAGGTVATSGAVVAPGGMVAPNGCGAAAAARRRRYFGGLQREWRESWRENAVHLVRIRLYHRILWGRRKEKACLALPPPSRRRRAATAETTGCQRWCHHWVPREPTAPSGGMRRAAATGNFDGRRVPKLFIATATPLVLLVLLKTVAHRGLDGCGVAER